MSVWSKHYLPGLGALLIFLGACNPIEGKQTVLPSSFLDSVAWSFAEPVPASKSEMIKAVAAYHAKIRRPFKPDELTAVSPFRQLDASYTYAIQRPSGNWEHIPVTVRVDGKDQYLTYADILWQLHRVAHEHLKDQDRQYFEGFEDLPARAIDNTPLYKVNLGS